MSRTTVIYSLISLVLASGSIYFALEDSLTAVSAIPASVIRIQK